MDQSTKPLVQKTKKSRGQAMIELALTAPLMLAVMGASFDVGKMVYIKQRLDTATADAARFVPEQNFQGPIACQPANPKTLCQTLKSRTVKLLANSSFVMEKKSPEDMEPFPIDKIQPVSDAWMSTTTTPISVKPPGSLTYLKPSDKTLIMFYGVKSEYPYKILYGLSISTLTAKALGFNGFIKMIDASTLPPGTTRPPLCSDLAADGGRGLECAS